MRICFTIAVATTLLGCGITNPQTLFTATQGDLESASMPRSPDKSDAHR